MKGPKKLSLTTDKTHQDKTWKQESLGELLDKAVEILNPDMEKYGVTTHATWIARLAIRAVCEEIIRRRCVPVPFEVSFVDHGDGRKAPRSHRALDAFRHGRN